MGITSDLIVVGPHDNIYITTYLPYPDSTEGRKDDTITKIKFFLLNLFKIKKTLIYYCESSGLRNLNIPSSFKCWKTKNKESNGLLNNGIAYDEENELIYVNDMLDKKLKIFKRNLGNKKFLRFLSEINLWFAGDNIHIKKDQHGNTVLYIGASAKINQFMQFTENSRKEKQFSKDEYFSGAIKITIYKNINFENTDNIEKNLKIEKLIMQDKWFKGISSAYQIGNKVYMTSWCDDGVLICKIKNLIGKSNEK